MNFPRGIDPELLISQVRNTMPYVFGTDSSASKVARLASFPPAERVRIYLGGEIPEHFDYFTLCLCAHYLTCGTPVPTDVDNQIRRKLWAEGLPLETTLRMARYVLESRGWDFTLVSSRHVRGAVGSGWENEVLSGHLGEWFTVATAAYGALGRSSDPAATTVRAEVFAAIADEVNRHSEIFGSLWRAADGLGCLKAASSIAHNLGDLDRVMDLWELSPGDRLRLAFYKLGARPFDSERRLRYLGRLWSAGELYKAKIDGSSMAIENHRHFGLRKPRALRQHPEWVLPTAPFFDAWGAAVASGENADEVAEVFDALVESWERQRGTYAYGRALHALLGVRPEFRDRPGIAALFGQVATRTVLETSRDVFEKRWASEALRHLDEIPSRAE